MTQVLNLVVQIEVTLYLTSHLFPSTVTFVIVLVHVNEVQMFSGQVFRTTDSISSNKMTQNQCEAESTINQRTHTRGECVLMNLLRSSFRQQMKRSITECPGRKQQTLQQFNTRRKRSRGGRGEKGGQEVQVKGRCKDERENNEHFNVICAQHTRPSVTCQDGDGGENRKAVDEERKKMKRGKINISP